jgi:hypothetical protein
MQESLVSYSINNISLHRFTFIYQPKEIKKGAVLSFHLTAREKKDIVNAVTNENNTVLFKQIEILQHSINPAQGTSKE